MGIDEIADSLLLSIERWIFPTGGPRTLLITCGESSAQVLVSSMMEAMKYIPLGMAGLCGVRSSVNPKISTDKIAAVEGLHIDIDSPENLELARHLAKLLAEKIAGLDAEPLVVFTGGKGYAVRVFLDLSYGALSPSQYRKLVKEVTSLIDLATVEMPHPVSSHIRVPYTRHEKTKSQILLFDWRSEKHVENPEDVVKAVDRALERRFPYIEELVSEEEEEIVYKKPADVGRKVPKWVEKLIEYLKTHGELCHLARVAVAQWLYVAGWDEESIVNVFRHAKDFKENKTRYHVRYEMKRISSGLKPISCRRVKEECQTGIPEDLCQKNF